MGSKFEAGAVRIAHTRSGESGADEAIVVEFDDRGVTVTWPRPLDMGRALSLNDSAKVPDPLIARDGNGWITLLGGSSLGASASSNHHSEQRIRYLRAVKTGARDVDYEGLNGLTSEVDGLAKWAKRVPVTTSIAFDNDRGVKSLSLVAENLDPLSLGGPLDLRLETSYLHQPEPSAGEFKVSTALLIRTRSSKLIAWDEHQQVHRMMQDLMSLAFGVPCRARIVSVMREDDQERPPTGNRRYWHDAYEPSFQRTAVGSRELKASDEPLFYLEEADPERVASWLSDYALWARPTWIAVTALFQPQMPVELQLLQVAVGLEALGYAIAERAQPGLKSHGTFEQLLKHVFDALGCLPDAVLGPDADVAAWCRAFSQAYKGIKHADQPLTDGLEAWSRAKEGLTLIRCWLAAELGVSGDLVTRRLREGRVRV